MNALKPRCVVTSGQTREYVSDVPGVQKDGFFSDCESGSVRVILR